MTCSKSKMCFNLCQCRKIIVFSAHLSGITNNNNSFVALVAAPQILKLEIMFSIVISCIELLELVKEVEDLVLPD